MNYIHKLQARVEELEAEKASAREDLLELIIYLNSSKFHDDETVQVRDVLHRLGTPALHNIMMRDG
jgi:hypothetical protein